MPSVNLKMTLSARFGTIPEDFQRQFVKEHFAKLTPQEREEVLQALPPE